MLRPDLSSRFTLVSLGLGLQGLSETKMLSAPFEITKIAAQTSEMMAKGNRSSMSDALRDPIKSSYQQKGTIKTAMNIVKLRGFLGLYAGFRIHISKVIGVMKRPSLAHSLLVRDTIGSAIYFSTYESTKQMLVKLQGSNSPVSPLSVAIAGGFCGLASVTCVSLRGWWTLKPNVLTFWLDLSF